MPATLADIQRKYGESVYPLYKDQMHEPYMENDNGGYQGVILYDEMENKIRCEECGEFFNAIGMHIKKHGLSGREYREKYGLLYSTPLCSKQVSRTFSERALEQAKKYHHRPPRIFTISEKNNRVKSYIRSRACSQSKNKNGLCDSQIIARLIIVRDMAEKEDLSKLTSTDLQKFDNNLLGVIQYRYGNYQLASKALGLGNHFSVERKKYKDSELISQLRRYVMRFHKLPTRKSWTYYSPHSLNIADIDTFYVYFGSWRRAKMMAGLDQLLEEVKNK